MVCGRVISVLRDDFTEFTRVFAPEAFSMMDLQSYDVSFFFCVHSRYLGDVGRGHVSDLRNETKVGVENIGDDHTGQ